MKFSIESSDSLSSKCETNGNRRANEPKVEWKDVNEDAIKTDDASLHKDSASDCAKQPSLADTCRQVREETLPNSYGSNLLKIMDSESPYRNILGRLDSGDFPAAIASNLGLCGHIAEDNEHGAGHSRAST